MTLDEMFEQLENHQMPKHGERCKLFTVKWFLGTEGFYLDTYATSPREAVILAKKTIKDCGVKAQITSVESYDGFAKLALVA